MKKFSKKFMCGVMALAVAFASLPLLGVDFSDWFVKSEAATTATNYIESADGNYVYKIKDDYFAEISKYIGNDTNVVVPERIDGLTVTYIGAEAFTDSASNSKVNFKWRNPNLVNLESVVLPETLSEIGTSSFENCKKLTSVKLPEGLWSIGERAFYGTGLTEIDLPDNLYSIKAFAFTGTNIKELVIPGNVEHFYQYSLYCPSLEKIVFEGHHRSISGAFLASSTTKHYPKEILFANSQPSNVIEAFGDLVKNEETGYWEAVFFEDDTWYGYTDEDVHTNGTVDYIVTPENEAILVNYNLESRGSYYVNKIKHNYQDIPVVEIAPYAFYQCNLEKITVASSVRRIHYGAFAESKRLYSVHLPEGLKIIESEVFSGCSSLSLQNTGIPESVTEICAYAFNKCCVTYVHGAENVEKIGAYAFYNNSIFEYSFDSLKEVAPYAFGYTTFSEINFPEGLERIWKNAFYCSTTNKVTFPESLKRIDHYAFERCFLKEIVLPQGLEYLGTGAFRNNKIKAVEIPPLLTELNTLVFANCPITEINVPSNIKKIGSGAFSMETYPFARTINIAEGVEEIDVFAFQGSDIEVLTIPSTVKILDTAFLAQSTVDVINYNAIDAEIRNTASYSSFISSSAMNGVMPVINFGEGIKRIPDYFCKDAKIQRVSIPDTVEYIGKEAFYWSGLTEIKLPSKLKEIGEGAFSDCKFTEVEFPDGLEKIGENAFYNCNELISVEFPDTVTYIGDFAFAYSDDLKSVTLPKNAEHVGQFVFDLCTSLKEVTIPENVTNIGETTFHRCENIETVDFRAASCDIIPYNVYDEDALPHSPFVDSKKLKSINLYNTVKELPAFLYSGLQTIDKISLPESVTDIGVGAFANSTVSGFDSLANIESIEEYAFKNCYFLEEIDLGNKLMIIGTGAFSGCDWLKSLYIPDSVSNIETSAFEGCIKLESVRMSPNVDFIPRQAFNNCKSLSEFEWNSDRKLIGRYAFGNCVKLNDFDFVNIEKLYKNSFTGSGVAVAQLGESQNEQNAALETIEVQSFKNCESLATIGIGGNVSTVKSQAFADCTNLETAVIADSVTNIADDAFDGCDKLIIYCSEDSYAYSYAKTQDIKVSTFVIAPIPNQTYTGFEIEPEVSVTASGDTLNENIDFGVTYANNVNVGKADVNVKGKGDFRMFASRANFTIVTKSIANVSIAEIPVQDYTGNAVTPVVTITDGGKILQEGTDYTVTYSNNTNEGKASIKIIGKGNYSGSASAEFNIQKLSQSQSIFNRILTVFNSLFARIKAFFVGLFM